MERFGPLVIGAVVSVLLVSAVLLPFIGDSAATDKTFTNDGYARYTSLASDSGDEIGIVWNHTQPQVFTVGEDVVDCSTMTTYTSVVFGDNWTIRFITNGTTYADVQFIGSTGPEFLQTNTTNALDMTITLSGGTMTVSDGTTTRTATYTTVYYLDSDGSMIMKKQDEGAYLLKSSSIINANGNTSVSGVGIGVRFDGTIEDGYEFTLYRNSNSSAVDNVVSHYSEVSGYVDLVNLTSITFNLTPEGGTATEAVYTYFLVPYQVTAEKAYINSSESALIAIIPILVIAGLIVGIAAVIGRRAELF